MFYGTRWGYNLLYFITAMSPAYFLFLLQFNGKFENAIDKKILQFNYNIYILCAALVLITFFLALILRWLLKSQFKKGIGRSVADSKLSDFAMSNIEETNGSVVSFLLGNVIPVVLILGNSITEAVIVFLLMQFIIYILTIRSSEIFPNVVLIILGVDLCKTKNGDYLFIIRSSGDDQQVIYQIGDVTKSKLYITIQRK